MPSSAPYTIAAAGQTDVGRRRQHNEDAFLCDPDHRLFVVADGMGGHAAGEVASAHAVQAVQEFIASFDSGNEATWPFGIDKGLTPAQNLLVNAIKLANRSVCGLAQEKPEYTGMGTTIVGCRLEEGEAVIGHVGDSRVYLLRGGRLHQLTADHSWVNEQVQQGALREDEAKTHRWRNIITRALGNRFDVEVDWKSIPVGPGDTLLLCTDGLSGVVDEGGIVEILRECGEDLEAACRRLIEAANAGGGPDNVTVVVVRLAPAAGGGPP